MTLLGWMYDTGSGVAKSVMSARHWYEMASNAGSPEGAVRFAEILEDQGDSDSAAAQYRRAALAGSIVAPYRLALIHDRKPDIVSREEALRSLQTAEQRGHVWAKAWRAGQMRHGLIPGGKLRALTKLVSAILIIIPLMIASRGNQKYVDPRLVK
jgi:TPR repeat protein